MANTLLPLHETKVTSRIAVDTVGQLIEALRHSSLDEPLDDTHVVEVISETLSDGSKALSVRIRAAEPV